MKIKLLIIISLISWVFTSGYSQDMNKKMTEAETEELFERVNRAANGEKNSSSTSGAYGRIEYLTEEQRNAEAIEVRERNNTLAAIILISVFLVLILIVFIGKKVNTSDRIQSKNGRSVNQEKDNSLLKNAFRSPAKLDVRTDGFYLASFKNSNDKPLFIFMFFTSKGFVAYQELEEFDNSELTKEDYQQILAEGEALEEIEISNSLTKYQRRGADISMKFYDPEENSNIDPTFKVPSDEPNIYNEWSGRVISNGLLLDLEISRFNSALKDYSKKKLINNLKFEFMPVETIPLHFV